jgi:hypothetical protein
MNEGASLGELALVTAVRRCGLTLYISTLSSLTYPFTPNSPLPFPSLPFPLPSPFPTRLEEG